MQTYRISLIGFGGVNRALAELIATQNPQWAQNLGFKLVIVGVSDLMLGSVVSANGIDPRVLLETKFGKGGFADLSGGSAEPDSLRVIREAPANLIAEATFTNATTGQPAIDHCRAAFLAGRSVVTTNKGPVALEARALKALAQQHGVGFEYEGAVMSGTPVLRMAEQTLAGAGLTGFSGILNGTSNYILTRMEAGLDFAAALAEAQALGFAEADPTADAEGFDVRLKVVILAQELLGAQIRPEDVSCEGITGLTNEALREARAQGQCWKLVGAAARDAQGQISASVAPRKLPLDHPLAGISGPINAVTFETELLGNVTVSGPGAGRIETAYALLSDIIALHRSGQMATQAEAAQ